MVVDSFCAATGDAAATATALTGTIVVAGLQTKTATLGASDTAATAAAAINALSDATGVTASARNVSELKFAANGAVSLAVKGDNATAANVTFNVSGNTAAGLAEAVKGFNDVASQTGITAKLNSAADGIILTNEAGADINLTNNSATVGVTLAAQNAEAATTPTFGAATAAAAVGGTVVSRGTLELASDKGYSITGTSALASTTAASSLKAVNTIDVSTVDGSTKALKIIDAALSAVNGQRASFGALQSRFETTVNNLQSTSENMSASRGRIQDADFAAETANLSRSQILQQAGTAMVAQANQLPQGVLALLR